MGRPRKSAIKENVAPQKVTVAKTKSVKSVETLEREIEELTTLATAAIEGQIEARQIANEAEEKAIRAEDKLEEIQAITAYSLSWMLHNCEKVEMNTGSLLAEDVKYHVNLLQRTIDYHMKKA